MLYRKEWLLAQRWFGYVIIDFSKWLVGINCRQPGYAFAFDLHIGPLWFAIAKQAI